MNKHFDRRRLDTVQLVPPTPFTPDGGRVVPEVLSDFVRSMVAVGIRVFLPAAGTGEFHSLTVEEALACIRATRNAAGPECTVLAPVGLGVHHACAVAEGAQQAGADAILLMPPVHPYLCDAGFRDYYRAIAAAVPGMPMLCYKRGSVPSDRLLQELAKDDGLIGVKYAVNDVDALARLALAAQGRLGLYCGTAERFAPFFHLAGATGYTSGAGCLAPRLTLALHAALARRDYPEAMRLLSIIRPIEEARGRDGDSFNITLVKYGLEMLGRPFGPPRPPQRQLDDREKSEFRAILEPILTAEAELARKSGGS
jgi:4-hydroxy-tetrahydrodipicolinate synthase